ncbi:MAG: efflux transporter outer membrane subunit [Deltaproteobacteria bacterium]|jgi:Cu(I)/Ag(I) efflux system outer membrane protein|nr:efflux transporter outer membrane subunit [Deltaproteobacteria bacterium]
MSIIRALLALGLAWGLGGCSLAPEYLRPAAPVPRQLSQEGQPVEELALPAWESFFQEPRLQALIRIALIENRDLRLAALNVLAARATYGVSQADRYPNLDLEGQKSVTGGADKPTAASYELGLRSGFEVDFFGRLKNMSQAAFQRYLEATEAARAARLSLIAQVTEAYLETRLSQETLDLTNRTLHSWRASVAFVERSLISGQSTLLDLEMARAQVARAEAAQAAARTNLVRAENALKLLTGQLGQPELPPAWALADWPRPRLPANIASSALLNRPDLLEAERSLIASHADIGVARAAFFPSLSLTGQFGYMSDQLGSLVAGANSGWSFIPGVSLPLFAGGRNRQNLELAETRRDQAVAQYEKAIQVAFREVAEALAARPRLAEELSAQRQYLAAQKRVLALATDRYQNGVISYLETLSAQRDVLEAEMTAINMRKNQILNDIQLYLALGGGDLATATPDPALAPKEEPPKPPRAASGETK